MYYLTSVLGTALGKPLQLSVVVSMSAPIFLLIFFSSPPLPKPKDQGLHFTKATLSKNRLCWENLCLTAFKKHVAVMPNILNVILIWYKIRNQTNNVSLMRSLATTELWSFGCRPDCCTWWICCDSHLCETLKHAKQNKTKKQILDSADWWSHLLQSSV